MEPLLELHDYLLKLGIWPDAELIDDGKYHLLTDAGTGKQYEYCVFKNRTFDVFPLLKCSFSGEFGNSFGGAA